MRDRFGVALACLAAPLAGAAHADTISQTASGQSIDGAFYSVTTIDGMAYVGPAFRGFDATLGTLSAATLSIAGSLGTTDLVIYAGTDPATQAIGFDDLVFTVYSGATSLPASFAVSGGGSASFDGPGLAAPSVSGTPGGSATLAPGLFAGTPPGVVRIDYAAPPTQTFSGASDFSIVTTPIVGDLAFTLRYDYAPARGAAPVPEPATWATLALGFALAGAALRRARREMVGPAGLEPAT